MTQIILVFLTYNFSYEIIIPGRWVALNPQLFGPQGSERE